MKSNPDLGAFVIKSTVSKAFLYFSYGILVLFTGLSLFIYFKLIIPVTEGTAHFSGDISILYYCIVFIMALALLILGTAAYRSRGILFYLYQNGMVTAHKGNTETLYFKDIQDVYLFTSGKRLFGANNIAVRKNNTADWYPISARYSDIYKVIELIRSRHAAVYAPLLLKKLEEGQSADFTYVDFKDLAMKQFTALNTNSYLNVKTKTMQVFKDRLVVDSETIYFKEVLRFSVTDWTNQMQLMNTAEKVVFKKAFTSVFSGDSFIVLLDELVNKNKFKD
ncbi:MAG: DUF6585 family protein [Flavobacterium circumlabens]|uniref:DUF6585 family protein n=1 Tax=Flavobacterium circumlabens TaxID=2133765 RepID=UPI003263A186